MEKILDADKIFTAFKSIALNVTINDYAIERVAFGYEKPGDPAPIDLYLKHINFGFDYEPQMRKDIPGFYINEQECISTEQDYAAYVHDLYVMQMESIFVDAPKDVQLKRASEEIPILPRFRDFLFEIEPVFAEVLKVEVEYNVFDLIVSDKEARKNEYSKWLNFVTAILLKPLRAGGRINRYVKDISSAPHYIRRLIEKKGSNFYLKPIDINSYEYSFALFSLMLFKNDENGKLLELKMFEWERQYKAE